MSLRDGEHELLDDMENLDGEEASYLVEADHRNAQSYYKGTGKEQDLDPRFHTSPLTTSARVGSGAKSGRTTASQANSSRQPRFSQQMSVEEAMRQREKKLQERRAAARAESSRIMSKKFAERDVVKAKLLTEKEKKRIEKFYSKQEKIGKWQRKTEKSPFLVDLLAENERIDEENRVKLQEEARRAKLLEKRKHQVKNEIILKALTEGSDLEALRQEKRLLAEEERRLKALRDLEKVAITHKEDHVARQKAQNRKKNEDLNALRKQRLAQLEAEEEAKREALMAKLNIEDTAG